MVDRVGRGVLVFGVLGFLVAALTGSLLRVGCFDHDDALAWFSLPVLVPFAIALAGGVVAALSRSPSTDPPQAGRRDGKMSMRAVLGMIVALPSIAIVTATTGALVWWPDKAQVGPATGLAFGVAALPLVFPLAMALRPEARRDSILDVANKWLVWTVAGAIATIVSVLTVPRWKSYPSCTPESTQAIAATFFATALAVFAASVLFVHVGRSMKALSTPPRFLDVGVGDAHHETTTHPNTAYRDVIETVSVVHGDPAFGRKALRARVLAACAAVAVALACGSAGVVLR
jgi:hypothetical protein